MNTIDFKYSITKLIESKRTSIDEQLAKDSKLHKLCSINLEFYHGNLSKLNAEELLQYHKDTSRMFFLTKLQSLIRFCSVGNLIPWSTK